MKVRSDSISGGEAFGRLIVTGLSHSIKRKDGSSGERVMNCLCECGQKIKVRTSNLKSGNTRSCGCYQSDETKKSNHERDNIESISDHMATTCICGCARFNLLKSGCIECDSCQCKQDGMSWILK